MSSRREKEAFRSPGSCRVLFGARPLPPLTNFEKEVFAYIKKRSGAYPAAAVNVDEDFPFGIGDALASEGVTVLKQVHTAGGVIGGGAAGGAAGGDGGHWKAWVKFDAPTMAESEAEDAEMDSAAEGGKDASSILHSLGVDVNEAIGGSGGPTVVASVLAGSVAKRWGITPGMEVVETASDSVTIAATTLFRGLPPLEEGRVPEDQHVPVAPARNIGGMMLADETRGGKIARMLLSMFFRAKTALLEGASDWGNLQRPSTKANLKATQAKKQNFREELLSALGFDVKMKDLRARPGLLQVESVVEGFLADLYGLRVGDTLLSVNGHFLVGVSRDGFVARAAEGLKTCASGKPSNEALRFVIFREKAPQPPAARPSKAHPPPSRGRTARNASTDEGGEPLERAPAFVAKWDEPSPMDAVVPLPARAKAAAAEAAARKRSRRAEARARPDWWGPREKGTGVYVMKLRPAERPPRLEGGEPETGGRVQQDRGVEESKGGEAGPRGEREGEPVPPGIFLREDLQIGDRLIPADAQLVRVRGVCCHDMAFEEARGLALSAGKGDELIFEDV